MRTALWRRDAAWRPPDSLLARLDALAATYGDGAMPGSAGDGRAERTPAAEVEWYLALAERLLADLLRDGGLERDDALDLLAADALVTYAFQVASDDPEHLSARASDAMRRIAAVVATTAGARQAAT